MKQLGLSDFAEWAETLRRPFHEHYFAMYSSVYGGIVTDPVLMMVPVDDHVVHRGDGVFETLKCVEGGIYNLQAHLDRLRNSAAALGYPDTAVTEDIEELIAGTVVTGGRKNCSIRVLLSRGPGSLGVNPSDCPDSQLYIVASRLKASFMESHPEGATAISSSVLPKQAFLAGVKSCNYIHNVLMKKEAADRGVDFVLGFDEDGFLTESATENAGIVTRSGELVFPDGERLLKGTTMTRVSILAAEQAGGDLLAGTTHGRIARDDIENAAEALIVGTTPDVTAMVELDGVSVGGGTPGQVQALLNRLLKEDILGNEAMRTDIFPGYCQ
ncbi:MAG: aminotransferase class IV [Lentisphaerae bacterium]|nr:aminotransferase class IV [Lentisphaerota bacterium]